MNSIHYTKLCTLGTKYKQLQGSQVTLEQSEYEKSNSTDETL